MANEQPSEAMVLNSSELERLNDYDSRLFGFLNLEADENTGVKNLLDKAVQYYDQQLKTPEKHNLDLSVLCRLGHFHLLLGDYTKALSAYQKFFTLQPDYWKDATFLYGLAMVYFHFSAYQW
ncbi:Histone demethylase UTY [Holothuria leucospilota]|uniref:Histone demethylase UTY n=1 Tax=Holothuria leucospilota TaxID=206669 RepID=A0A9Q1BR02_HOLLE|nr:Histone demethylase UTY [Holothuria leucospilota]